MTGSSPSPITLNEWFGSLPEGRQDILKEDKWMLAEAAFAAGIAIGQNTAKPLYIAKRHGDGSHWQSQYFSLKKQVYAHSDDLEEAMQASSVEELKGAMYERFCTGINPRLTGQALGFYVIIKGQQGVFEEVVEGKFVPAFAFAPGFDEPVCRLFRKIIDSLPQNGKFLQEPEDVSFNIAHYWALICCAYLILKSSVPGEVPTDKTYVEQDYVDARFALQDVERQFWKEADLKREAKDPLDRISWMIQVAAQRCGLKLMSFGE